MAMARTLIRDRREKTQTERRPYEGGGRVMQSQAQEDPEPPETGRGKKALPL